MRKQDRIANQQKQRQPQDDRTQSQPAQEDREQLRGSDSERMTGRASDESRPQRQSGKLPLPD